MAADRTPIAAALAWPVLAGAALAAGAVGFATDLEPLLVIAAVEAGLATIVVLLERTLAPVVPAPGTRSQLPNDIGYLILSLPSGAAGEFVAQALCARGAIALAARHGSSLWPDLPLAAAVALGLVAAEFGSYWQHRIFHRVGRLWPFHAVHHDPERLYFMKTFRLHPLEFLVIPILAYPPLILLGAPPAIFLWYVLVSGVFGILAHTSLDLPAGPLDYVFNTPAVHRIHHSRSVAQSNTNYATNLMLWDLVFRTFRDPAREPVEALGIEGRPLPEGLLAQLVEPFRGRR